MPGVIGDLRGQRFGRLKVPDGADPVIHNHNAYRPVIYDAARWAWSLDSTCPAGSQAQTGRAAPGDHGAGGTATRSCVFRPTTNDAYGQIQVRRPAGAQTDFQRATIAVERSPATGIPRVGGRDGSLWELGGPILCSDGAAAQTGRAAPGDRGVGGRRRRTAASRMTGTAPDPERRPDKAIQIQADNAPASANRGGPDVDAGRDQTRHRGTRQ